MRFSFVVKTHLFPYIKGMTRLYVCSIVIGIVLSMVGCGKPSIDDIPAELSPLIVRFQQDALVRGYTVSIDQVQFQIKALPIVNGVQAVGDCQQGDGNSIVILDQNTWGTLSDTQKEMLLYHELGHCVLKRTHDSSYFAVPGTEFSIVNSVMYPSQTDPGNYAIYREHYVNELFADAKK